MTFRTRTLAAVLGLLAAGSLNVAFAQPVAPVRPGFSGSYGGLFGYNRGNYYFGNGFGNPGGFQNQAQNNMLQQQLNYTNQSIANLQNFLSNGVNSNLPITGHGATFNNLGHWYNNSPTGGGGGGGFGGGLSGGRAMPGPGFTSQNGGAGGRLNGTSGTGVPIGPARGPGQIGWR